MKIETNNNQVKSIDFDGKMVLKEFRSMVESNPKTNRTRFDDQTLLKFLRSREMDPDQALRVLTNYISMINERGDLFTWDEAITKANKIGIYYHYPIKNVNGAKIIIIHPGQWKAGQLKIDALIKQALFFSEITLMDENVQKIGCECIIDMRGLGWSQIYNCGLANGRLISFLTDQCIPLDVVAIHIIHENRLTDIAYNLFKPFLDAKIKQRIIFHGHNLDHLYQHVPRSVLPESLGGINQDFTCEYYNQLMDKHKDQIVSSWKLFQKDSP